jgi:hypothetical protein
MFWKHWIITYLRYTRQTRKSITSQQTSEITGRKRGNLGNNNIKTPIMSSLFGGL